MGGRSRSFLGSPRAWGTAVLVFAAFHTFSTLPPTEWHFEAVEDVQCGRPYSDSACVWGLSNKEIATSLTISVETVKEHVQNILRKLAVADRTQAAVWAVRHGLV